MSDPDERAEDNRQCQNEEYATCSNCHKEYPKRTMQDEFDMGPDLCRRCMDETPEAVKQLLRDKDGDIEVLEAERISIKRMLDDMLELVNESIEVF